MLDVPEPPRHCRHVHRGVAAADHDDPLAHVTQPPVVKGAQKIDSGEAVWRLVAGYPQRLARLRADADEYRIVITP